MAACGQKKTLDLARESFQNFDPQDLNTSDLLRHLTLRSWKSLSFCVESLAIQFSRSVSEADSGGAVGQLLGRISKLNLAPHQSVYNCVCVYFSTNLFCRHVQHPFTMAAPIAYSPLHCLLMIPTRSNQNDFLSQKLEGLRARNFANLSSRFYAPDLHDNVSCFPTILAVWDCFVHKTHFTESVINFPNSRLLTRGATPW